MKKKGFYLLPIVKLLDSYKVYSIIKVDPCGEVSWNWVLRCFSCFFSAETTITTHSAAIRTAPPLPSAPPCVIYSFTHILCCSCIHPPIHPSIHRLSFYHSLPLSIRSGTTSSLVEFQPFFLAFFHLLYLYFIVLSVSVLLFVRSPPRPRPPEFIQCWRESTVTELNCLSLP